MFKKQLTASTLLAIALFSAPAVAEKATDDLGWGGSVAGGLQISTGNTETEDLNFDGKLSYATEGWKHKGRVQAFNKKENDVRTDEEYRINLHSAYKLSDRDDLFAEVEYIDDRFSGYDYRISEVLGYNHHWYKQDDFGWSSSVAAGYQHNKTNAGKTDNSPLARLQNDIHWEINEHVDFENTLRVDASDVSVFYTETGLKTMLHDALYLRLAFQTETLSEVPAGREKTDTDTTINIGYEF